MTDELRAVCERVRNDDYGQNEGEWRGLGRWSDSAKLAIAYLAEHPADDEEPATMEWLKQMGAKTLWQDDLAVYLTKDAGWDCNEIGIGTDNLIGWGVADTFSRSNVAAVGSLTNDGSPATRGHVRRLCAALGITLPAGT